MTKSTEEANGCAIIRVHPYMDEIDKLRSFDCVWLRGTAHTPNRSISSDTLCRKQQTLSPTHMPAQLIYTFRGATPIASP